MTQAVKDSHTTLWVLLGKVSLIVTLCLGLIQVEQHVWPNRAKLYAEYTERSFNLPPDVETALRFPTDTAVFMALTNSSKAFYTNLDNAHDFAMTLENNLRHLKSQDPNYRYDAFNRYSTILTIHNVGDKEAEQIIVGLSADASGVAVIVQDADISTETIDGPLKLHTLRPHGEIMVEIWSHSSIFPVGEPAIISDSDGVINVKKSYRFVGWAATVGSVVSSVSDHPLPLLLMFAIFVFAGASSYFAARKPNKIRDVSVFKLEAKDAELHGNNLKYEDDSNWENLGYWYSTNDYATWEVTISKPGRYFVFIEQACIKECGGKYELTIGSQKLSGVVEETGTWGKFVRLHLGEITIQETGEYTLKIQPLQIKGNALMNLRLLILKLVE